MSESTLAPSVTHRDPKGRKFVSIVESSYDKAGLSEDEAQRVNDTPGLADLMADFIEEHRCLNKFANEEEESIYVYPPEFKGLRSPEEQAKILLEFFPGLDPEAMLRYFRHEYGKLALPDWVEGPLVVPSDAGMMRAFFPEAKGLGVLNSASLNLALDKIVSTKRPFYNNWANQITPERLRRHVRTTEGLARVAAAQPGDFWVLPTQLGLRYRGRSTRRATYDKFVVGEFGATAFAGGCLALSHPERYVRWEELDTDFPGDEFAPGAGGGFSDTPCLCSGGSELEFRTRGVSSARGDFGTVSWFFPQ